MSGLESDLDLLIEVEDILEDEDVFEDDSDLDLKKKMAMKLELSTHLSISSQQAYQEGWVKKVFEDNTLRITESSVILEALRSSTYTNSKAYHIESMAKELSHFAWQPDEDEDDDEMDLFEMGDDNEEDSRLELKKLKKDPRIYFPLKHWLLEALVLHQSEVALGLIQAYEALKLPEEARLDFDQIMRDHFLLAVWLHRPQEMLALMKHCHYQGAKDCALSKARIKTSLELYEECIEHNVYKLYYGQAIVYNPLTLALMTSGEESESERVDRESCIDALLPLRLEELIDVSRKTPLMQAVQSGCISSARKLIPKSDLLRRSHAFEEDGGKHLKNQPYDQFNALMFAVHTENIDMLNLLMAHMPREKVSEPAMYLSYGSETKNTYLYSTPLMRACIFGHPEMVETLMPYGYQNFKDANLNGALSMLVNYGNYHLTDLFMEKEQRFPQPFNTIYSNVNFTREDGFQHLPLMDALRQNKNSWEQGAENENIEKSQRAAWVKGKQKQQLDFIQRSIDKLPQGISIGLFLAVAIANDNEDGADLLWSSKRPLSGGASHPIASNFSYEMDRYEGVTPLMMAVNKSNLEWVKKLVPLSHVSDKNHKGHTALDLALLGDHLEIAMYLSTVDDQFDTILKNPITAHKMAIFNAHRCIHHWKDGLDFSPVAPEQVTEFWMINHAIFSAIRYGSKEMFEDMLPYVDFKVCDDLGNTLFMAAAIEGKYEMMELLVEKGFRDFETRNHLGHTAPMAWCYAIESEHSKNKIYDTDRKKVSQNVWRLLMTHCDLKKESLQGIPFQRYSKRQRWVNVDKILNDTNLIQEVAVKKEAFEIQKVLEESKGQLELPKGSVRRL